MKKILLCLVVYVTFAAALSGCVATDFEQGSSYGKTITIPLEDRIASSCKVIDLICRENSDLRHAANVEFHVSGTNALPKNFSYRGFHHVPVTGKGGYYFDIERGQGRGIVVSVIAWGMIYAIPMIKLANGEWTVTGPVEQQVFCL